MDFRDIVAALHGSTFERHTIDLAQNRVEIIPSREAEGESAPIAFENVVLLKWSGAESTSAKIRIGVIGLEKLGQGEPWRLYLKTFDGAEIELTCGRVTSGGEEVTGIGRSYRH
jgi:hypothetical protein